MKYDDYILLGADKDCALGSTDFLEYFKWLLDSNFEAIKQKLFESIELKRFPKRSEEQLIMASIATTPNEISKKLKQKQYYSCNAQCAYTVITRIFTQELYNLLSSESCIDAVRRNYEHILLWLLLDISDIANAYQWEMKDNKKYRYNVGKTIQHTMPFHQILRQTLFGQFSYNSFSDMEISYSTSVIRQLIELRIRRAFGIICFVDNDGSIIPISFSIILEVLKEFQNEIKFPINLSTIEKIYTWSNMYIHSGLKDFTWIPYSIEYILRPLTFGNKNEDGSWSIDNGIKTSKETIEKIKSRIIEKQGQAGICIPNLKPECEIVENISI